MSRKWVRLLVVLLLALATGGALSFAAYRYVRQQPVPPPAPVPTQPVVVAAADLEFGSELRSGDLRVVRWPVGTIPAGSFASPGEIAGRGLIVPVVQNEPILPAKLAPEGAGSGLPPVIPDGMRALSVRVNEVIGVSGYALPGTRVDVLATVSPTRDAADTTTKLILSNIVVLAAGTRIEPGQDKPAPVTVVTLLVAPDEAERLTLASTEGKIQLALRNPLDQTAPPTPGVRPAALLGGAAAPPLQARRRAAARTAPPRPPEPVVVIEVIRGDKRSQEIIRQEIIK